jgi:FlaA1/EpsC-like NDP-sugar epimerase
VSFNLGRVLLKYRRPFVIVLQLAAAVLSHYAAFWLRFDGDIPSDQMRTFVEILPCLIAVRALSFIPFRLYEGLWRYAGFWDLRNIVSATFTGSAALFMLFHWGLGLTSYPRSVFLTDSVLLIVILGGLRMSRRIHRELSLMTREKGVLIYGAGSAGEMVVRDMRKNAFYGYEPVGFLDDDPVKVGQRIHGVKVLGTRDDLRRIMVEKRPDAVLIAISRAEPASIRAIVEALEPFKVPIQTLPNLRDLLNGRAVVNQIRSLSVEDLLDRNPVALDAGPVQELLEGRRVLVTGAGGSIGTELCRQIALFHPSALVLVDRYENGLHAVFNDLASGGFDGIAHPLVADLTDEGRMLDVWRKHRPEIVLHAAAHKHVPLMERNPCEAVLNNVRGARMLTEMAVNHGIERFLMISTDKAVNPVSVMGATKRVAEMLVQTVNGGSAGVFGAVRFGNVLASNGSVVPRFLEQIGWGGPVTVTHPEMCRYFMLIAEAVGLVLQAIAMAKGSDIFALEMGNQMKVLDLARNLIRLSGFVPGEEIQIVFTGPRPGEKLREELVGADEEMEPSSVNGILRIRPRTIYRGDDVARHVCDLERAAMAGDVAMVLDMLRAIVPTYRPSEFWRN